MDGVYGPHCQTWSQGTAAVRVEMEAKQPKTHPDQADKYEKLTPAEAPGWASHTLGVWSREQQNTLQSVLRLSSFDGMCVFNPFIPADTKGNCSRSKDNLKHWVLILGKLIA